MESSATPDFRKRSRGDDVNDQCGPISPKVIVTRRRANLREVPQIDPWQRPTFALFAFNRTSESDAIRMKHLSELYDVRITSASEQGAPPDQTCEESPYHFQCDFKRSLLPGIDRDAVVLMLDYFWLQGNWWAERYGENWIQSEAKDCKVVEVFEHIPNLEVCIIPLDSSTGFMLGRCQDDAILEQLKKHNLCIELIDWSEAQVHHPLCLATSCVFPQLTKKERKSYLGQGRYVGVSTAKLDGELMPSDQKNDPKTPYSFAVIHRASLHDWRGKLTSYRKASA